MSLSAVRHAIADWCGTTFPGVRIVEHGGKMSYEEIERWTTGAPSMVVSCLGIPHITIEGGMTVAEVAWAICPLARDLPNQERSIGTLLLVAPLIGALPRQRWGGLASKMPQSVRGDNLYTPRLDKMGVSRWVVSWTQAVDLPEVSAADLADFLRLYAVYAPEGVLDGAMATSTRITPTVIDSATYAITIGGHAYTFTDVRPTTSVDLSVATYAKHTDYTVTINVYAYVINSGDAADAIEFLTENVVGALGPEIAWLVAPQPGDTVLHFGVTGGVAFTISVSTNLAIVEHSSIHTTATIITAGLKAAMAAATQTVTDNHGTLDVTGSERFSIALTSNLSRVNLDDGVPIEAIDVVELPPATALAIDTLALPHGTIGEAYNSPIDASGGFVPYAWSLLTGTLPAGLALGAKTGIITGTPTTSGTSSFTARVTDEIGKTADKTLTITIGAPIP